MTNKFEKVTYDDLLYELMMTKKYKKCKALKEYINLMLANLFTKKAKGLQKHHIVQKAICRELHIHSDFSGHNTVYLTPEQHQAAHNLLAVSCIDLNKANQARGCGNVRPDTIKKHILTTNHYS